MEEQNPKKKPLLLDWGIVLGKTDEEPPELVIAKETTAERPKASAMTTEDNLLREEHVRFTDHQLEEAIKRKRNLLQFTGPKLPDKGEKLRLSIMSLEEEWEQRKLRRSRMDIDECEKPAQSVSSNRQESDCTLSEASPKSWFGTMFSRKMEEDTDSEVVPAFDKELSIIGHCNGQKVKSNGGTSQRRRQKALSTLSHQPFECASNLSRSADHYRKGQKGRAASSDQFQKRQENFSNTLINKKDNCRALPSNGATHRKGKTFVLVDEDEIEDLETMEREKKLAECMKDAKIFYPSSDDPESVEICYADTKCLDADGFLTSPVINFYIRYLRLQASSTKRISDYHFFNTFFYKKLKQAVSYKGSDKESEFVKFRRWWKDVNLFQKSYVLIPIHEDLHWSLVIICIPDKEYGLGPIILHLDSLGLHHSKSIFEKIKSFLTAEWNYMQVQAPSDLPFPDRIWENLPRRIDERRIVVPQQKNDYDCGPFMLFFMERFVNEAPERLKRKDLDMFGKQWFRPEEASGLRVKIRRLLLDQFRNAKEVNHSTESSSPSSNGTWS